MPLWTVGSYPQPGNTMKTVLVVAAVMLAAVTVACSKTDTTPVDSALSISPSPTLDSMSALEQAQAPGLAAPAPSTSGAAPRRTTTTRRTSSSSSSGGSTGSTATT